MAVLYGNDVFSILVISTKKLNSIENVLTFSNCHIKNAELSNGGLFWKSVLPFLEESMHALYFGFKLKSLRKGVFLC